MIDNTYYVYTLVDIMGRHIVSADGNIAYCGARGTKDVPSAHRIADLCEECANAYLHHILGINIDGEAINVH